MLYFIYTIDGDWGEYFDVKLSDRERLPEGEVLLELIQREIELANRVLQGRFIHFVHTSPRCRDFFLEKPFRKLWKELVRFGGDTGLHCHEDDPYKDYYYHDGSRMEKVIGERSQAFRKAGLDIRCYRSGFLGFSSKMIRTLEQNEIYFDFSCQPERFLKHGDILIADWRGAPQKQYRMSYDDHCKPGDSKVWEIPVGVSKGKCLYFEKSDMIELEKISLDLKGKSMENRDNIVVSVLGHTYEYESKENIKETEEKLTLLKKYGTFVNLNQLEKILF